MENINLDDVLKNSGPRQFWLKPIGVSEEPELQGHGELFPESEIEIAFALPPDAIAQGDVLIAWRVGISKLIFVAERLPGGPFATSETYPAGVRERFPHSFKVKNLTPTYGGVWPRYDIRPFRLARKYNQDHPDRPPAKLGALQFGKDKLRVDEQFGMFLIAKIRDCDIKERERSTS